eukprot:180312_1
MEGARQSRSKSDQSGSQGLAFPEVKLNPPITPLVNTHTKNSPLSRSLRRFGEATARKYWLPKEGSFCRNINALFNDPQSSTASLVVQVIVISMIIVSVTSFMVETIPEYRFPIYGTKETDTPPLFFWTEVVCIVGFTIEYVSRFISTLSLTPHEVGIPANAGEHEVVLAGRKLYKFVLEPMNLVDLAAIVPFYIGLLSSQGSGLQFLRVLRLARVFRVMKLGKYSTGMRMLGRVMDRSMPVFYLLGFLLLIFCILFSSLIYFAEQGTFDPATQQYMRQNIAHTRLEPSPFRSIPGSFFWVFTTTTTVG